MEVVTRSSSSVMSEEEGDDVMLPGYRFHPTDEELVGFYLRRKVEKKPLSIELIKQIDIYKHDPWDLPKVSIGDNEWYFFCKRGRKYRNSVRPNRVTGSGFWKATGIDKPIRSLSDSNLCIGLKKSLVYYRGSAGKGSKTDWMMHEFRLPPTDLSALPNVAQEAEVWTLCRIFKRVPAHKKYTPDHLKLPKLTNQNIKTHSTSFESDNNYDHYATFCDTTKQNQRKPILSQPMFMDHMNMASSAPLMASFWNPSRIGDDFFIDESWDELRSVVELANIDSSMIFGCR